MEDRTMKKISIYEPAMCCNTGISGVGVNPELMRISAVLKALAKNGIIVERFNLANEPQAFLNNKAINEMLNNQGVNQLPAVIVDDEIVITGRYPTNEEFAKLLDIPVDLLGETPKVTQQKVNDKSNQNQGGIMKIFNPKEINLTKYLFFTGKGGVGKTSIACATAVTFADSGKKVLLISTDPASNLQDVFKTAITNKGVSIPEVPNLTVTNIDPVQAAEDYKESIIAPYRGKMTEAVLKNMEEQLSGSCTVEIAAFNEFSNFIANGNIQKDYDYIIFDTAPTGHTLRMLQLPSAWSDFIHGQQAGTERLGQLSGMRARKEIYEKTVEVLSDPAKTTLMLVSKPETIALAEAERAARELQDIGISNQILIINAVLTSYDDSVSESLYNKQQQVLENMPNLLKNLTTYVVPLRAYDITGVENVRNLLTTDKVFYEPKALHTDMLSGLKDIKDVIEDLDRTNKKVIFTMGKGGVGKTTIAAAIALGLAAKGEKVHLTTTDPAAHLKFVIDEDSGITTSYIDEKAELETYKKEVLAKARETMAEEDVAYVEEDLRSPCTQEIAVFHAFAEIVDKSEEQIVVIDTAPTGHTLLLLDSSQRYYREIAHFQGGDIPESVKKLLPRLRDANETEVIIVTRAETTPVYEALRLAEDLRRAGISNKWWVINASLFAANPTNKILKAKADSELQWINKVDEISKGNFAVIKWEPEEIKGEKLNNL